LIAAQSAITAFKTTRNAYCPTCKTYAVSVQNNPIGDGVMSGWADAGRFSSITSESQIISSTTSIACDGVCTASVFPIDGVCGSYDAIVYT
jgi:hypothetical protein